MNTQAKPVSKYTVSFGLSLAITSVVNALLVIAKEKSSDLQAHMKVLAGHHWTAHSLIIVVLFLSLGWFFSLTGKGHGPNTNVKSLTTAVLAGVAASTAIITGFYLFAD